jgi:phosphoribosylanthranilate isomerase
VAQQNFVSISGISDRKELQGIYKICQEEIFDFPLVIGYQVSSKSINLGTQNPRQPKFLDLGDLNTETLSYGFFPAVHYYTKDNSSVLKDLEKIAELGILDSNLLLQLNTLPLPTEILREIKKAGPEVIFKAAVSDKQTSQGGYAVWKGEGVQDVKKGAVKPLIAQVRERKDFIDYVMFDPSHGTNLNLDLDEKNLAIRFGKEITSIKELDHLGLVYAGGIKPSNTKKVVRGLFSFFPDRFSIDAESGVRNKENKLDLDLVRAYLINFREACQIRKLR